MAEKRQLDADRRHWENRLTQLETEIESEPARIEEGYRVKASRVEPVGTGVFLAGDRLIRFYQI